ncbi:hypothetical protein N2152v2_009686 [Parachlorella kessleri]
MARNCRQAAAGMLIPLGRASAVIEGQGAPGNHVPYVGNTFQTNTEISITAAAALQLRAMAVCSAWRDCLDPRKWPIDTLKLNRLKVDDEHLVPWIISTRPAVKSLDLSRYRTPQLLTVLASVPHMVVERLCMEAASQALLDCLPAIYHFPSLRKLILGCREDFEVPFDFLALAPLTALEELAVSGWEKICWEGGPLLPRITQLRLGLTDSVALNTVLPSLQHLRVCMVSTVMLGGQYFQAPQLSSLSLYDVNRELAVRWSQLGSLREVEARSMNAVVALGAAKLSALTNVTALRLHWSERQGAWDSAYVLLQAASRSLRSLSLDAWPVHLLPPPALTGLTQLTSLQCGSLAIIPQLAPLKQLQELQFTSHSVASLSVDELALLSELASLRRLRFSQRMAEGGGRARCLKLRAMAVCSAWRDCLDPRKWPIDSLELPGWDIDAGEHLMSWFTSTRPAVKVLRFTYLTTPPLLTVLEKLCLVAASQALLDCLPAVYRFPGLRKLDLVCKRDFDVPLDSKALAPLTALEELAVSRWDNISWEGGPLPPRITKLQLLSGEHVTLNTALPSLQQLTIQDAGFIVLGGQHFQAPQLSSLTLHDPDKELAVSWSQLGSLKELHARFTWEAAVWRAAELSALTNLTALSLGWSERHGAWDVALVLLQAVPRSLRSLNLDALSEDRLPPPILAGLTQLTSLECGSLAIIPQLSLLEQLQALRFSGHSAASLSVHELALLSEVRAVAVCSAWREGLDPRKWPIGCLELDRWEDDIQHLVPWITSTRPAVKDLGLSNYKTPQLLVVLLSLSCTVLKRLCVEAASQALLDCLPAIYRFPSLQKLFLNCAEDFEIPLDFKALTPLTTLEELGVFGWRSVCWEGGPLLLPGITHLRLGKSDHISLNTALPSLRELRVYAASSVMLGGQHFQAPGLSSLSLHDLDREVSVSWSQLGSIKELEAQFLDEAVVVGGGAELSALTNLTALSLGWSQGQGAWDAAHALLEAAPRSLLRSLSLDAWPADPVPAPALTGFTQLTSLQCGSLAIIPQLAPLKQLQELHFSCQFPASLSVHELVVLSELASLRRLRFIRQPTEVGVWARYFQVRAMAVCSAWRDCLDPMRWPIDRLELDRWEDDIQHLVPWIASTRPAVKDLTLSNYETPQLLVVLLSLPCTVLERLCIEAASQALLDCLPAIYQFPTLRKLFLVCKGDCDGPFRFDFRAFTPLTALEELGVSGWEKMCWEGGPLLPRISYLHFDSADHATLNTALPSLRQLHFFNTSTVRLGGQHLWVPQLSSLSAFHVRQELSVSWGQLGSVMELEVRAMGAVVVMGAAQLSAVTNLTALRLGWRELEGAWDAALVLLQAAPCSLRSLSLDAWPVDQSPPSALTGLTQLTSLQCGSLAIISQLSPLKQLKELQFTSHSAASLSVLDLAMLSELASLRRLRFYWHSAELGVRARCLEVLHKQLPDGCEVD